MNDSIVQYVTKITREKTDDLSPVKLNYLLFLLEGWYFCYTGATESLVGGEFQGWVQGPVIPEVFKEFETGKYDVYDGGLDKDTEEFVRYVLDWYIEKPLALLQMHVQSEDCWMKSREGLKPFEAGYNVIPIADIMADFVIKTN